MQRLSFKALQQEYTILTGRGLQLQGGIFHHPNCDYSIAFSVTGVSFYHDEFVRGLWKYSLQGKVGDQDLTTRLNAGLLKSGRKIVVIQKVGEGEYVLHGIYEYRGQLETLYHPGIDGVERKMYRAVLHKL
jgi:hypothetical protein